MLIIKDAKYIYVGINFGQLFGNQLKCLRVSISMFGSLREVCLNPETHSMCHQ